MCKTFMNLFNVMFEDEVAPSAKILKNNRRQEIREAIKSEGVQEVNALYC